MNKITVFVLGAMFGEITMLPAIAHIINTPVVRAEIVPNCYELVQQTFVHEIKNVKNFQGKVSTLKIHLVNPQSLQKIYEDRFGEDDSVGTIMGFYDDKTNEIFCVYDANVLSHELKHVFEGSWHR